MGQLEVGVRMFAQNFGIEARHGSVQHIKGMFLKRFREFKREKWGCLPLFSRLSSARVPHRGGDAPRTPASHFPCTVAMAESGVMRGVCIAAPWGIYVTAAKR